MPDKKYVRPVVADIDGDNVNKNAGSRFATEADIANAIDDLTAVIAVETTRPRLSELVEFVKECQHFAVTYNARKDVAKADKWDKRAKQAEEKIDELLGAGE